MLPNGPLGRGTVQTEFQVTSPLGKGTALYRVPGWSGFRDPLLAASIASSEAEDKLPPISSCALGVSNPTTGNLCRTTSMATRASLFRRRLAGERRRNRHVHVYDDIV